MEVCYASRHILRTTVIEASTQLMKTMKMATMVVVSSVVTWPDVDHPWWRCTLGTSLTSRSVCWCSLHSCTSPTSATPCTTTLATSHPLDCSGSPVSLSPSLQCRWCFACCMRSSSRYHRQSQSPTFVIIRDTSTGLSYESMQHLPKARPDYCHEGQGKVTQ